ncbi:MAG TPA: hypothetical protein VFN88_10795, partial [Caulobacteraceae bacterium]|nr:hypothetical protein [Caulobacteraceae bacterium]
DKRAYLQGNISNIFDKYYFSRANTFANGVPFPIPGTSVTFPATSASYFVGAPRFFSMTLGVKY